ncbi:MAG: ribonuclease P protein component [Spirochaetaceae bacterium]|jgi:ribonuclease P protein component|nr:ribonuclease P protein component [Spirochaetaceae bacterium]GMO29224.1 MAG: ribonuclease P protein component [Termitinemataceae bacterium]
MNNRFPCAERLKKNRAIKAVFKTGACVTYSGAKLFYVQNEEKHNRLAFVFPRSFGNAVKRNRAKRLGREAYRHLRTRIERGWDLVLLVYPNKTDNFAERLLQLSVLFKRSKIWNNG